MKSHVRASLEEAQVALDSLLSNDAALEAITEAGRLLAETLRGDGRVFSCGNGGSMCDAMHFAEELSGRYRLERRALAATAISDPSHLSCVANDYGYEQVFARYLEAHARHGDCLLAISTSGTSKNILAAAYVARERGVHILALTGKPDTPLGRIATVEICTPGGRFADRVQELHIKVIHILIELVERQLFGETYT
ncbi:SIS domain-containing protein [Armatimonas sp.]|uniref:SIS domain-containing protein n=1 Tax=Armatimonas sp. TaxID=1872638 RepID=UPI0037523451